MPFKPVNPDHAVIEAVFGLILSRPFTPAETEAIVAARANWDDLPKLSRAGGLHIMFSVDGNAPVEGAVPSPIGGALFDRINTDGSLAWRLRVEGNSVLVNCLEYERWDVVWGRASDYLRAVAAAGIPDDNPITGLLLQYIDGFEWEGGYDNYRLTELLSRDSENLCDGIWDKGPRWHHNQGWYRAHNGSGVSGQLLERIHIDSVIKEQRALVKIDNFLSLTLDATVTKGVALGGDNPLAGRVYSDLHDVNKAIVRDLLTQQMAERIGLNA